MTAAASCTMEYDPPFSLWHLVESCCPIHELYEVKSLLGESLIEQSIELHHEVKLLLEIWNDYRHETLSQPTPPSRLPEPPTQRELLKAEIKFFVDCIHDKAKTYGRDANVILSRHNSQILDYVLDEKGCGHLLHASLTGCETPRSVSRASPSSGISRSEASLCDIRMTFDGTCGVLQFDEVASHLRQVLQQEVHSLVNDISFLQSCLEQEVDIRSESRLSTEPTLAELREERKNLEAELNSPDLILPGVLPGCDSQSFNTGPSPTLRLQSIVRGKQQSSSHSHKSSPTSAKSLTTGTKSAGRSRPSVCATEQLSWSFRPEAVFGDSLSSLQADTREQSCNILSTTLTAGVSSVSTGVSSTALRQLMQSTSPNHVTIRTRPVVTTSNNNPSHLVHVATIADSVVPCCHIPVPPAGSRPAHQRSIVRPSSAQRFRNMVLDCRDGK